MPLAATGLLSWLYAIDRDHHRRRVVRAAPLQRQRHEALRGRRAVRRRESCGNFLRREVTVQSVAAEKKPITRLYVEAQLFERQQIGPTHCPREHMSVVRCGSRFYGSVLLGHRVIARQLCELAASQAIETAVARPQRDALLAANTQRHDRRSAVEPGLLLAAIPQLEIGRASCRERV